MSHSRQFQGTVSALLYMNNYLSSGSLLTVFRYHITLDWSVSAHTTRASMQKHIKGDIENAGSSAGQLPATHAASEFSVLTFGTTQEHGVPHFLFTSTACLGG